MKGLEADRKCINDLKKKKVKDLKNLQKKKGKKKTLKHHVTHNKIVMYFR